MTRDPDEGTAVVFELVDDDAADLDAPTSPDGSAGPGRPPGGDGDETSADEPPVSGSPGWAWRGVAPVAAVLAIVLGTGLAIDGARDGTRIERMRDLRGGVADLSVPLDEIWSWSGDVDVGEGTTDVAVLGDELVFESESGLVALDPATGEEAWTIPLGEDAQCGPMVSPVAEDPRTPTLVCLQGRRAEREVLVVGPGGAVSDPRTLDAADAAEHGQPHTGPAGTVLRAKRVGPPSEVDRDVRCDSVGDCSSGSIRTGRDLVLRAEDAVTGAERWSVTIPFRTTPAAQCVSMYGADWGSSENRVDLSGQLAPDAFGARVWADLVNVEGCGIRTAVTPDGVRLGTELAPGLGYVDSLGSGRYLGISWGNTVRATLYDDTGGVVGRIRGYVVPPRTTDEVGPPTLIAIDELGRRMTAHESDGTARWDITLQSGGQEFIAQVGETAVITSGAGTVRGLDVATGEDKWVWDGSGAASGSDGGYFGSIYVTQAFTDGELVLLLSEGDAGARGLVTLDAASGEMIWEQAGGGALTRFDPRTGQVVERGVSGDLVAVDGHLLEVTSTGVRGLG